MFSLLDVALNVISFLNEVFSYIVLCYMIIIIFASGILDYNFQCVYVYFKVTNYVSQAL